MGAVERMAIAGMTQEKEMKMTKICSHKHMYWQKTEIATTMTTNGYFTVTPGSSSVMEEGETGELLV